MSFWEKEFLKKIELPSNQIILNVAFKQHGYGVNLMPIKQYSNSDLVQSYGRSGEYFRKELAEMHANRYFLAIFLGYSWFF